MATNGSTTDRLVVVISTVTYKYNEEARLFAASFADMGLTSFGDTHSQAVCRLKSLFKTYIHALREFGVIEETLDRLGVKWFWEDEYPEGMPKYEDTNQPGPPWLPVVINNPANVQAEAANNQLARVA